VAKALSDETIDNILMTGEIKKDFSAPKPKESPALASILGIAMFLAGGVGGVGGVVAGYVGATAAGAVGVAKANRKRIGASNAASAAGHRRFQRKKEIEKADASVKNAEEREEAIAAAGRDMGAASAGTASLC